MEQIIRDLHEIERKANELGRIMRYEYRVLQEELDERLALGLQGELAIQHYNNWMQREGLDHLMV